MYLWAVFFAVLIGNAHADPILCNQFWAKAATEPPFQCELYTKSGFPKTVSGSEMRIYRYSDGWADDVKQMELLGAVSDAIDNAVPYYAGSAAIPRMYFVFYNEFNDELYAEADWQHSTSTEPCRVRLYFNIPDDRELAHQIAAHEIFHCVQLHGIVPIQSEEKDGKLLSARWWVEGSAEYMSSLVYPSGNGELEAISTYRPSLPLYHQPNPYSTALFFHGIQSAGFELQNIIGLLKGQPQFSTFAAERAALAKVSGLDEAFHRFAANLVDKKVTGAYGKKIPNPDVPAGEPYELGPHDDHVGLSVIPFTIMRSKILFKAGTTKTMMLGKGIDEGKIKISFRKKGQPLFEAYPGSEYDVSVPCDDEKGVEYDLVYTSTADSGEAQAFQLDFKGDMKECRCEDKQVPLDKCLVGNWHMNNIEYAAWLHELAPQYDPILVQGNVFLSFDKQKKARHDMQNFKNTLMLNGSVWMETLTNGTVDWEIIQQAQKRICLRQKGVSGTYSGSIDGQSFGGDMQSAYEGMEPGRDVRMSYECNEKALKMVAEETEVRVRWKFDKK